MASYDRQLEIIQPSVDRLIRLPLPVSDAGLVNPLSTSPLALIDGELLQPNTSGQWARASDAAKPSFLCFEERGFPNNTAAKKVAGIMGPSGFLFDTIVFNSGLTTQGAALQMGTINDATRLGANGRSGLIAYSAGVRLGYVFSVASANGGTLLRVFWTQS
jgi:hypothetical protein